MEVKINIPDNCELIKVGNTYVIKEKYGPRTWEEYCKEYPRRKGEFYIKEGGIIGAIDCTAGINKDPEKDKILINSLTEVHAFVALMQLRQLWKAWVEDFEFKWNSVDYFCIINTLVDPTVVVTSCPKALSFPSEEMAEEFLDCFRSLIEAAKPLI